MVVLDAVLEIQRTQAPDLAVRWNCKAAKCGSCAAEVNGKPRLMCKTRLEDLPTDRAGHGRADADVPVHPGPRDRRLLELRGQQEDPAVQAAEPDREWLMYQATSTGEEIRKCIECFLCQDVCHVMRDHRPDKPRTSGRASSSGSPASISTRWTTWTARDAVEGRGRPRAVQHHEVLHRGLPRGHPHHRQRDHPAEGARRRPPLRPAARARAAGFADGSAEH